MMKSMFFLRKFFPWVLPHGAGILFIIVLPLIAVKEGNILSRRFFSVVQNAKTMRFSKRTDTRGSVSEFLTIGYSYC
jgi:hypothetical protein